MSKENLLFIGKEEFGLTEKHIGEAIKTVQIIIEVLQNSSHTPNDFDISELQQKQKSLTLLTKQAPQKTLQNVHQIFTFIQELESSGSSKINIAGQTFLNYPDIAEYAPLLRQVDWGNKLTNEINFCIALRNNHLLNLQELALSN